MTSRDSFTEPQMHQSYLDYLDQQKNPSLITRSARKLGNWFGRQSDTIEPKFIRMGLRDDPRNVPTVTRRLGQSVYGSVGGQRDLPVDPRGRTAVYGVHEGEAVYGPVNWDQYYRDWNRIGEDYNEFGLRGFYLHSKSLTPKQIEFIESKGFNLVKPLDVGGFSEVWIVSHLVEEFDEFGAIVEVVKELALKVQQLRFMRDFGVFQTSISVAEAVEQLTREADLHVSLDHPNIVKLDSVVHMYDSESGFPKPICICIFMELMDGNLSGLINKSNPPKLSPQRTHQWFVHICEGLRYLHGLNIAHLDIKPPNVLFKKLPSGELIFKLSDFGLAVKSDTTDQRACTPGWEAPEVSERGNYRPFPADIYSLGLTLLNSLGGRIELEKGRDRVLTNLVWYRNTGPFDVQLIALIKLMLSDNPNRRPTIGQICNHSWVTYSTYI